MKIELTDEELHTIADIVCEKLPKIERSKAFISERSEFIKKATQNALREKDIDRIARHESFEVLEPIIKNVLDKKENFISLLISDKIEKIFEENFSEQAITRKLLDFHRKRADEIEDILSDYESYPD